MINKISIIFPIYNEESRLPKSLIDIEKFIKLEKSLKTQIIFVNDGSTDNTFNVMLNSKEKCKNICILNLFNDYRSLHKETNV